MTELTASELKILFVQIMFVAILTFIFGLAGYNTLNPLPDGSYTFVGIDLTFVKNFFSFLVNIIVNWFWLPPGLGDMTIIVALLKTPFTIISTLILVRLAKDLITQWI